MEVGPLPHHPLLVDPRQDEDEQERYGHAQDRSWPPQPAQSGFRRLHICRLLPCAMVARGSPSRKQRPATIACLCVWWQERASRRYPTGGYPTRPLTLVVGRVLCAHVSHARTRTARRHASPRRWRCGPLCLNIGALDDTCLDSRIERAKRQMVHMKGRRIKVVVSAGSSPPRVITVGD
jgi:hypothetical protein